MHLILLASLALAQSTPEPAAEIPDESTPTADTPTPDSESAEPEPEPAPDPEPEPEPPVSDPALRDVWSTNSTSSYGGFGPTVEFNHMSATEFYYGTCVGIDAFDVADRRRIGVSGTICLGPRVIRTIEPKVHLGWETTNTRLYRFGVIGQLAAGLSRAERDTFTPAPYVSLEGGFTGGWTPLSLVALDSRVTFGPQVILGQGVGYRATFTTTAVLGRLPWQQRLPEVRRLRKLPTI